MLTPQNQDRQFSDLLKVLIDHGYEGMLEVLQTLLNEAAKIERSEALRTAPYERAEERTGYANGFKDKMIHTRLGSVRVNFPQVRDALYEKVRHQNLVRDWAVLLATGVTENGKRGIIYLCFITLMEMVHIIVMGRCV